MIHRDVTYTIRAGIQRDQWVLVIAFSGGRIERPYTGNKRDAEALACRMIDAALEAAQLKRKKLEITSGAADG